MTTAAVFVHGLWLNGAEFTLLRRRLAREHGIVGHRFSYPTVRGSMDQAIAQLARFVDRIDAERVHFIGHSFGGVVLCRYFQQHPCPRPGRVVILGSPLTGSRSARTVARNALMRRMIGPLVNAELVEECAPRNWACHNELGVIAGTSAMGLGRLFTKFDEDFDGTVGVSETKLPGHKAHLALPVSHMGMLVSKRVAGQVGAFLSHGSFAPAD
ncbi:MAG TPA: alpha/beta fold hydrolase [Steroidobacteraceae bacterium]|nr:alpha/beta fold hydrolase [Steroidobacteraceae bacterium]